MNADDTATRLAAHEEECDRRAADIMKRFDNIDERDARREDRIIGLAEVVARISGEMNIMKWLLFAVVGLTLFEVVKVFFAAGG